MIEVKTKSGFECSVNPRIKNDWAYLEHMGKLQSLTKKKDPDPSQMLNEVSWLMEFVLKDDKDRLIDHVRKNNEGIADVFVIISELVEIISAEPVKN